MKFNANKCRDERRGLIPVVNSLMTEKKSPYCVVVPHCAISQLIGHSGEKMKDLLENTQLHQVDMPKWPSKGTAAAQARVAASASFVQKQEKQHAAINGP